MTQTVRKKAIRLALAVTVLSGCETSATQTPTPATFSQVYAAIFPVHTKGQCTFCHSNPPNDISNGKLSTGADQAAAYAALVNRPSVSKHCAGKTLVVAGHPEQSLFYLKFAEPAPCGDRMPLGGDALTAEQLEMVRSWIAAGAKDN
jgi:hypothetical protein